MTSSNRSGRHPALNRRAASATDAYCGACGRPLRAERHSDCARLLELDPPRFCTACGHRLDVQVFPDRYRTACRECRRRARLAEGG